MTQTTPQGARPQDGLDRLLDRLRAMRRSRSDRVVAGVCAGIARELRLDPVLVRVVIGVLAFFGGAGVVIYAAGWLLMPEEGSDVSLAGDVLGRRGRSPGGRAVVLAVALGLVLVIALGSTFRHWDGALLLVALVIGAVLLLERTMRPASQVPPSPYATTPGGPAGPGAPGAPPAPLTPPASDEAVEPGAGGGTPQDVTTPYGAAPYAGTPYAAAPTEVVGAPGQPPTAPPPAPPAWNAPPTPPPPPAPPRPRSALLGVTLSLTLVALGTLAALDAAGVSVAWGAYWAVALAVVGLGLLVGTWLGRSRLLIAVGIVLAFGTVSAIGTSHWTNTKRVDVTQHPTSVSQLGGTHDYGAGDVQWDLRGVDFTGADTNLNLSLGAGNLIVVVPPNVDVDASASSGVGQIQLFGSSDNGLGNDLSVTDLGADGPGGGHLRVHVSTGVGNVEVRRG